MIFDVYWVVFVNIIDHLAEYEPNSEVLREYVRIERIAMMTEYEKKDALVVRRVDHLLEVAALARLEAVLGVAAPVARLEVEPVDL